MVTPALSGAVAGIAVALLAVAIGIAGGWRPAPPGGAPVPPPSAEPAGQWMPSSLAALAWRIRVVTILYWAALLAALGLTPLGAWVVRLIVSGEPRWRAYAAAAVIVAAWAVPQLASRWWLRQARRSCPALIRPRPKRLLRLLRLALIVGWLAVVVADAANLTISDDSGTLVVVVVLIWIGGELAGLALVVRRLARLPRPPRLVTALESLPGPPGGNAVAVVAGWRTRVANAAAIASFRRQVILVAPPLVDAFTDPQLRVVVAHELAHLRHGDTWWRLQRVLLMLLASAAAALTLYAIPALRHLAGLHTADLTRQSLPFLLIAGYLAYRVLGAAELRARRAEEAAADRRAVDLTGDAPACIETMARLGTMLGTPETWSLPRRLLTASHPAMGERLRLLSVYAMAEDASPARADAGRTGYRPVFAGLTAIALVAGTYALADAHVAAPPVSVGWYRVVPPPRFEGSVLAGAQLGSSVWSDGIDRFRSAVPVAAVYDKDGQPFLYVWGAMGDLENPAGELTAMWDATDIFANVSPGLSLAPDTEPTGPLDGYLQCEPGGDTCAWADYSGIVVVSQSSPDQPGIIDSSGGAGGFNDPFLSEQALAGLTLSFRDMAELPRPGARHEVTG